MIAFHALKILLIGLIPSFASGPQTPAEADFLIKQGMEAFQSKNYKNSAYYFERLIDRYPAHPRAASARIYFAIDLLRMGQAKKAKAALSTLAQSPSQTSEVIDAKLLLVKTYFELGQYSEAILSAKEILISAIAPKAHQLEALLLQSRAYLKRGLDLEARKHLDSYYTEARKTGKEVSSELQSFAYYLEMEYQNFQCSKLLVDAKLSEAQVIDQFDRRGTCVSKVLTLYQQLLVSHLEEWVEAATQLARKSVEDLHQKALHPPQSAERRTAIAAKRYATELSDRLQAQMRKLSTQYLEIVDITPESLEVKSSDALAKLKAEIARIKDSNGTAR